MRVSIKDIAKAAGVSHSTVSRALANNPLVAEATRGRIQEISRDLGYTPNAIARGLVTQRTRTVGVIVTALTDPFAGEIFRGVEEIAAEYDYRLFLGTSHADPVREVNLVKALREWRVDGVIVASSRVGSLYLPLLKEIGVPIVLINNQHGGPFIQSVGVDNVAGACAGTHHLIEQGHRVIGHIKGPPEHASSDDRLLGYQRALAEAHLPFDPSLVLTGNGRVDGGEQVAHLLTRSPFPTAFFCYNDMTAIGALRALKTRGLRVPQDVSLVGFDDIELASYVEPPLTTIRQPKDEMGRLAMKMVIDLLKGRSITDVLMPGELVVRESTSPPSSRGAAPMVAHQGTIDREKRAKPQKVR